MKCIYPSKISGVVASSEDPLYPAVNVLDEHPTLPWVAGAQQSTLTLSVAGGAEGLALFATNAIAITVTVKDEDGVVVSQQSFDLSGIDTWYKWFTQTGERQTELGILYPYQSVAHTVEIMADSGNQAVMVEMGVVRAGAVRRFRDPSSLAEGFMDYSIKKKLSSGAIYRKFKPGARRYSGELRLDLNTDFYTFMRSIVKELGSAPLAWWITDNKQNSWLVYAGFDEMPGANHGNRYAKVNWALLEEL